MYKARADTTYSLRSSDAILSDIRDTGQRTSHSSTHIRPRLVSKKMRSKTNFRKNLRKTRGITAVALCLGFLWRGWTSHPAGLQIFSAEYNVFGSDSQYSTNFFPVAVDRCFLRACPQLRVLSFSHVTSRIQLKTPLNKFPHDNHESTTRCLCFSLLAAEPFRAAGAPPEMHAIGHYSHLDVRQLGQPGACVLQWYVDTHGEHLGASWTGKKAFITV